MLFPYNLLKRGKELQHFSTHDIDYTRGLEFITDDSNNSLDFSAAERKSSNNDREHGEENSDDTTVIMEDEPGSPEHRYKLTSIVSHFGASASSGHYVADVYR